MIWLVWRRQRTALLVALGLFAVLAATLVAPRLVVQHAAGKVGLAECVDRGSNAPCDDPAWSAINGRYDGIYEIGMLAMLVLPVVVGVCVGAGLFGRELEQGTAVLALTQSLSRLRWWTVGLLTTAVPALLAVAALIPVANWALRPQYDAYSNRFGFAFETTGLVPVAYTLLAFTVAAVGGMVLRSALGAVVLTVVLQIVLQVVLAGGVRPHYAAPEELRVAVPPTDDTSLAVVPEGAWTVEQSYLDAAGRVIPDSTLYDRPCDDDFNACLRSAGAVQELTRYHTASRYWRFQVTETAILLGAVALLLGLGAWNLRRIS